MCLKNMFFKFNVHLDERRLHQCLSNINTFETKSVLALAFALRVANAACINVKLHYLAITNSWLILPFMIYRFQSPEVPQVGKNCSLVFGALPQTCMNSLACFCRKPKLCEAFIPYSIPYLVRYQSCSSLSCIIWVCGNVSVQQTGVALRKLLEWLKLIYHLAERRSNSEIQLV